MIRSLFAHGCHIIYTSQLTIYDVDTDTTLKSTHSKLFESMARKRARSHSDDHQSDPKEALAGTDNVELGEKRTISQEKDSQYNSYARHRERLEVRERILTSSLQQVTDDITRTQDKLVNMIDQRESAETRLLELQQAQRRLETTIARQEALTIKLEAAHCRTMDLFHDVQNVHVDEGAEGLSVVTNSPEVIDTEDVNNSVLDSEQSDMITRSLESDSSSESLRAFLSDWRADGTTIHSLGVGLDSALDFLRFVQTVSSEVLACTSEPAALRRSFIRNTCLDALCVIRHDRDSATADDDALSSIDVCPYELDGDCLDSYCTFLHFSTSRRDVERELLPLPSISLQGKEEAETKRDVVGPKSPDLVVSPNVSHVDIDDEDYIGLPESKNDLEDQNDATRYYDTSTASMPESEGVSDCFATFFSGSLSQLSLHDVLSGTGWDFSASVLSIPKPTDDNVVDLLIDVTWGICLASLAGRFDLARTLLTMTSSDPLYHHSTQAQRRLADGVFSLLGDLVEKSFSFNNSMSQDPFEPALLLQQAALVIVEFLQSTTHFVGDSAALSSWKNLETALSSTTRSQRTDEIHIPASEASSHAALDKLVGDQMVSLRAFHGATTSASLHDLVECTIPDCIKKMWYCMNTTQTQGYSFKRQVFHEAFVFSGAIKCCISVVVSTNLSRKGNVELCQVYQKIVEAMKQYFGAIAPHTALHMALVPIVASCVALGCALKLYAVTQGLITHSFDAIPVSRFSDILWSQLFQLRATFPSQLEDNRVSEQAVNQRLASICESARVRLRYLTLPGDWNVLNPSSVHSSDALTFIRTVRLQTSSILHCTLNLQRTGSCMEADSLKEGVCPTLLPMSIMDAGDRLSAIQLNKCQIHALPRTFGSSFGRLKVRSLE